MLAAVGARFDRFELLERLGAGGMGEVWRARDLGLQREVAVKFLPERFAAEPLRLERFSQEARAASALDHPNIVAIHEIGEATGSRYIVMEHVRGQTLRALLRGKPLSVRRTLDVAVQLADGLARAHAAGIAHRDLKPENVMVTTEGFVKILDFGLAKLNDEAGLVPAAEVDSQADTWPDAAHDRSPHTAAGALLGTVGYMSPEQARGRPADFRSDQFSLGVIVYEMATGAPPSGARRGQPRWPPSPTRNPRRSRACARPSRRPRAGWWSVACRRIRPSGMPRPSTWPASCGTCATT